MDGTTALGLCALGSAVAAGIYILWGPDSTLKKRGQCVGLQNLGNTCFLNAVLQALASADRIIDWLQTTANAGRLTLALLETLNSLREDGVGVISPTPVIQALSWHGWYIDHQQQDAHELYQVFLTTLIEERKTNCLSLLSTIPTKSLTANESFVYSRIAGLISTGSQSTVVCPLQGLLMSELICLSCQHISPVKYEVFDSLSLNLPLSKSQCSLHSCLLDFIKTEVVCDVECSKCSQSTVKKTFMKQLHLARPPHILCLHLKRTVWLPSGSISKSNVDVVFPLHLDLSFLSKYSGNGLYYELVALIEHLGGPLSGHYVTYRYLSVKNSEGSGRWVHTSDSAVYNCNLHRVLNASPYILFYSRVKL